MRYEVWFDYNWRGKAASWHVALCVLPLGVGPATIRHGFWVSPIDHELNSVQYRGVDSPPAAEDADMWVPPGRINSVLPHPTAYPEEEKSG